MSGSTYRRVIVFMTPGRHGAQALLSARELVDREDGWLTLAVPTPRSLSPLGCGYGAPSHFAIHPEICEREAQRELDAALGRLPDVRTNGLIIRLPFASELLRRVAAAEHDLLVIPAGLRLAPLRAALALRSPVPVYSPGGTSITLGRPVGSLS